MIQSYDPYLCREEHWNLYRDDEIDLPRVPLGSVDEDPHSARLRFSYAASELELEEETIRDAVTPTMVQFRILTIGSGIS